MTKTIKTTNTLKGIAISTVVINHYLNLNVRGDSTGFANAWIAIFFFLSGYGLYYSLTQHNFHNSFNEYILFYYKRIVRIFPLLWLAWLIELLIRKGNISFWIPTGIHASEHYWFIPAILQCYLVAPVIYLAIKKRPIISISILMILIVLINYFLYFRYSILLTKIANFINARWRWVYFLNILVFAYGMLFAFFNKNITTKKGGFIHYCIFWILILLITILMVFLKVYSHNKYIIEIAFQIAPIVMILLLCVWALNFLIANAIFEYLGRISYSIYLFHMSYYLLISNIGSFTENSIKELITTVAFFPIFIFACEYFEKMGNYFNRKLRKLFTIKVDQQIAQTDRQFR